MPLPVLNIKPEGIVVNAIPDRSPDAPADAPPVGYELELLTPTLTVTVGPFTAANWENLGDLITNPEETMAKARARAKITTPPGAGTTPTGDRRLH